MSNRRFEMYEYRQILVRMRLGDSDRVLAKAGLIGRRKASQLRQLAQTQGWLDRATPMPDDVTLAAHLRTEPSADQVPVSGSSVEPYRAQVTEWWEAGIQATTIHQALVRQHGFVGSYYAVHRFVKALGQRQPKATVHLDFSPGEAAQIDFGRGPDIVDVQSGELIRSWFFIMTLCWSRHQYAELVRDQTVDTWLSCHRRALEWFGGVPQRLIIDNAKCAIMRACHREPTVQRAYGECAEGYGFKIDACPPRQPQKKV
jgi:transposase